MKTPHLLSPLYYIIEKKGVSEGGMTGSPTKEGWVCAFQPPKNTFLKPPQWGGGRGGGHWVTGEGGAEKSMLACTQPNPPPSPHCQIYLDTTTARNGRGGVGGDVHSILGEGKES